MKRGIFTASLFIFLIFISSCEDLSEEPSFSKGYEDFECGETIPGIINVKFKEGYDTSTSEKASEIVSKLQNEETKLGPSLAPKRIEKLFSDSKKEKKKQIQKEIGLDRWVRITLPLNANLNEELAKWSARPEVEKVDLEYAPCLLSIPNDNRFSSQWYHHNTGQYGTNGSDIDSPEAWEIQKGDKILIATPDTSVFWHHEDLVNNIWQNLGEDIDGDGIVIQPNGTEYIYTEYPDYPPTNRSYIKYIFDPDDVNGIDDDNNSYIDDFIGWDFGSNDNDPIYDSTDSLTYQWHGSNTAGHAAATTNNSVGLAGSCWNCEVMAMRRGVSSSTAIEYAIENGAKVISMSWMGSYSGAYEDLFDYAHEMDILLFTGAGNFARTTGWYNGMCINENIICISGSTASDATWADSSYIYSNGRYSDFSAPSANVISVTPYNHPLSTYVWASGTSLGSPIAAGIAALIVSENPSLSADEVKSIMQSSLDPYSSVQNDRYAGDGLINSGKAVQKAFISKEYGSFPVAIIDESNCSFFADRYNIFGKATSPDFERYEIYVSDGHYSNNWTLINESSTPIENNLIYSLNVLDRPLGDGQIKLVVYDSNNQSATDITQYYIDSYPEPQNQLFNLTEGWNLFSPKIIGNELITSNLNSTLVAGYDSQGWKIDLESRENDSFLLDTWQGYYIYSDHNQSFNFSGFIPESNKPVLNWNIWNLISCNESGTFAELFFDYAGTTVYNVSIKNDSIITSRIDKYEIMLEGNLYWATLNIDLS